MISCSNVIKRYSDKTVLSGISLDVTPGKIFGLLGPSGAGKTTLIKILTGQIPFDDGSVRILGKDAANLSGDDRKKIGIMMDSFGVYERFSCADNLKVFADIYGVPHSKIPECLDAVGLGDAAGKSASCLSKGMRARLQLARVWLHSPEIIFLDEPTSGLDPLTMKQIHGMILDKKDEGCAIFLTTHNMEEAAALCDEVALLNEGVIVERGSADEICRKYDHQRKINIHLTDGRDIELPLLGDAADRISEYLKSGMLQTIHSSEPDLETVFLELTGRKFDDRDCRTA
ncbi:MAG: ABC transporter ATP-binding protein [Lachnospiraceae bacterium]|nr:ABC transporter ATP-binding protein [Lachnospiraceae bacterium]